MQLLDAFIAFALTLAAAATVATLLTEALLRFLRLRRRSLLRVVRLLANELEGGPFHLGDDGRRWFLVAVLLNPARALSARLSPEDCERRVADFLDAVDVEIVGGRGAGGTPDEDNASGHGKAWLKRWLRRTWASLRAFCLRTLDPRGRDLYEKVSLEHVLRRLVETAPVQQGLERSEEAVRRELDRVARRFEELGSAISADFRRRAQLYSLIIGVVLAFGTNIDGLRIFEAYLTDNDLTAAFIRQQAELEQAYEDARERLVQVMEEDSEAADSDSEALLDRVGDARAAIARLVTVGLPIGWQWYPACTVPPAPGDEANDADADGASMATRTETEDDGGKVNARSADRGMTPDAKCLQLIEGVGELGGPEAWAPVRVYRTALSDPGKFFQWLFSVLVTGLFIGLGAPFWFDVGKRLAQVRRGVHSMHASAETRMAGSDANGDADARERIAEDVLADVKGERRSRRQDG